MSDPQSTAHARAVVTALADLTGDRDVQQSLTQVSELVQAAAVRMLEAAKLLQAAAPADPDPVAVAVWSVAQRYFDCACDIADARVRLVDLSADAESVLGLLGD